MFYDCLKSIDWREKSRVSLAAQKAINVCLGRLNRTDYRLNPKIEQIMNCRVNTRDSRKSYAKDWHWIN